jgi:Flp pilus assembly pilin Flp
MSNTSLALVREDDSTVRDEAGATTAEYATVTGCGVGFAAVLFKFLTSDMGQQLLKFIFNAIKGLLPF